MSRSQKTDLKTLTTDIALALDSFAADAASSSELLLRLGLTRRQALEAADADEEVESCREDLRAAMLSANWRIYGDNTVVSEIDRLWMIVRRHLPELSDLVLTSKLCGYAVAEYVYRREDDGFLTLDKIINKTGDLENYTPKRDGRLIFKSQNGEEAVDTTVKHLLLTSRATAAQPEGDPAVARLFPSIMLRRHGLQFAMQFVRRYAQPYIVGKTVGDKDEFNHALYRFNAGGAATVGTDEEINILKLDSDGSAFRRLEILANARIQKLLLGKVKISDLENGSRAAQEVEEGTKNDRIDAYLSLLARAAQHLVDALLAVNAAYGKALSAPHGLWFEFEQEQKIDLARAERDKMYLETGTMRLTRNYYTKILGFEPEHIELVESSGSINPQLSLSDGIRLSDDDAVPPERIALYQALVQPKLTAILKELEAAKDYDDFAERIGRIDLSAEDQALIDMLMLDNVKSFGSGAAE